MSADKNVMQLVWDRIDLTCLLIKERISELQQIEKKNNIVNYSIKT